MSATAPNQGSAVANRLERAVRDAMHPGVVDCTPQTPMHEVGKLMAEHDVHCIVVDGLARGAHGAEQLVWGIVSDLDLATAAASGRLDEQAGEFAATEPVAVGPDEDLHQAAQLMAEHDCSHLIVTDEATCRPVGVLSSLDIARALARGMRPANDLRAP